MNILNDVADALRRVVGVSTSPHAVIHQVPGISTAMNNMDTVLGSIGMQGSTSSMMPAELQNAPEVGQMPHASDQVRAAVRRQTVATDRVAHQPMMRPGRSEARWENPIVDAAMPLLLRLNQLRDSSQLFDQGTRGKLALELRLFRDKMSKSGFPPDVVADASYLMCTYVDEVVNDASRQAGSEPYNGEPSLLVEFHGDAWGGEDTFADLERWMARTPVELEILEFYELILSFGCQGRYRIMERGGVLLADLRSQLHALIWAERSLKSLSEPLIAPVVLVRKPWLTAMRALGIGMCVVLALYAAWIFDLDMKGRPIRQALAAWDPPIRTINLAETLPPPLPRLLSEGWVNARKGPEGWLLAFKSDKAFDVGQANFRPEFRQQLDRLGAAFAPWPGDMEILGHSDVQPIKTKQFPDNMSLSVERARVVAQELMQTAVAGGQRAPASAMDRKITFAGRGDTQPLDPAKNAEAYERNRRVEILWKVANLGPQSPRAVER
ncbi:MAG: type IVB secretion system protein IcmH/DotU [Acidovorax sp.]|jgi:type VI secretion system protein ImpK|nr:type IVB secretion system protein IcmH/DotU [Acidovorax sp.]